MLRVHRFCRAPPSTQFLIVVDLVARSPLSMPYIDPPDFVATTSRELALPATTARMTPA
jgi:hypothetical protein